MKQALEWSIAVDKSVEEIATGVPPFPYVLDSLKKIYDKADIIVSSGTPVETLQSEWQEFGLMEYVQLIAGKEMGSKKSHMSLAIKHNYPSDQTLMIGDSIRDLEAAEANKALFFPIIPDKEEECWEMFYSEAIDAFFSKSYSSLYQNKLIDEFQKTLY